MIHSASQKLDLIGISPRPILTEITILIPTLGREMLAGCLESIARGDHWPARLIVVDQSASQKVADWLAMLAGAGLPTLHIPSHQRGVAAARNRGLEQIETRFVAITDDDCRVAGDWLASLARLLGERPQAVITGRVDPAGEGVVVSIKTDPQAARYTRPLLRGEVMYPNNMGCELAVFDRVGFFDERLFLRSAEDNDWSYRALRAGVEIHYEPGVRVIHLDWRSESQLAETFRAYARSQGGVYGKFLRRGDWFMAVRVLLALARALRRWAVGSLRRDREMIDRGEAYLRQLLPGIVAGWRAEGSS